MPLLYWCSCFGWFLFLFRWFCICCFGLSCYFCLFVCLPALLSLFFLPKFPCLFLCSSSIKSPIHQLLMVYKMVCVLQIHSKYFYSLYSGLFFLYFKLYVSEFKGQWNLMLSKRVLFKSSKMLVFFSIFFYFYLYLLVNSAFKGTLWFLAYNIAVKANTISIAMQETQIYRFDWCLLGDQYQYDRICCCQISINRFLIDLQTPISIEFIQYNWRTIWMLIQFPVCLLLNFISANEFKWWNIIFHQPIVYI